MATTAVTTQGKYELFHNGWTTKVAWARLYTDADVLVDEQATTLTHTNGTSTMQPSADIVFDVAAGTNDVSYVVIGYTLGLDVSMYTKTLTTSYDFVSAGTLTIDSWVITISGTSLTEAGKDALITNGLDDITSAKLYTSGSVTLLDTQTMAFSVSAGTGVMSVTAPIVFDVDSGIAYSIQLTVGTGTTLYHRILDTTYTFTTPGTLTVSTWEISI